MLFYGDPCWAVFGKATAELFVVTQIVSCEHFLKYFCRMYLAYDHQHHGRQQQQHCVLSNLTLDYHLDCLGHFSVNIHQQEAEICQKWQANVYKISCLFSLINFTNSSFYDINKSTHSLQITELGVQMSLEASIVRLLSCPISLKIITP